MPSEKILESKKQLVEKLTEKLQKSISGVAVDYKGINVADDTKLRKELREAGVEYFVIKNTLLRFAADKANLSDLKDVLKGSTAIAISTDDMIAPARILSKYAETSKNFNIKLGFVEGNILDAEGVNTLAKLPSREVLVAQALGGLNAPITGFVGVLNANLRNLVCALNAIAEKQGA